jgi:hypothetical protein
MLAFLGEGQYKLLFSFKPLDAVVAKQLEPHLCRASIFSAVPY